MFNVTSIYLFINFTLYQAGHHAKYTKQTCTNLCTNKSAPTCAQTNTVHTEPAAITIQYICSSITAHPSYMVQQCHN